MAIQWHPLFAELLRPLLEFYFDVETNMPVGDVPREADLVLLRRTSQGALPFRGLWRFLKTWNVLEYKGPTVAARLADIDLLVELGLGIHRRLNAERAKARLSLLPPSEVCFWYIVNRLGCRFRKGVEARVGPLAVRAEGIWSTRLLDRDIFFVSGSDVAVETDSLPLCVLGKSTVEKDRAVAEFVVRDDSLLNQYGRYLVSFHPEVIKELMDMARISNKKPAIDLRPAIELVGLDKVIEQVGVDEIIKQIGWSKVIKLLDHDKLTPAERKELQRILDEE